MNIVCRKIISVNEERLVVLCAGRCDEPYRGFVWVAKSGADPRAWYRPDAPNNRAPWRHGRLPADDMLVSVTRVRKAKRILLEKIRQRLQWTRSQEALRWQRSRARRAVLYFEEKREQDLELGRAFEELLRDPKLRKSSQGVRALRVGELMQKCHERRMRHDLLRRWRMRDRDLPRSCPFDKASTWEASGSENHCGYRPANSEFSYRRYLLLRWQELDRLERWLGRFPEGALDYVDRHGFTERRWHLINLWIRVPAGRELFDDIPALAVMLASGWCFRGKPEPNLFRSLRRLLRRKRVEALRWLGFPPQKCVLKLLRELPPKMLTVLSLLGLRKVLLQGSYSVAQLSDLPSPLNRGLMVTLYRTVTPSLPLLQMMATPGQQGKILHRTFVDAASMAGNLDGQRARRWLGGLRRVRGPGGLRQIHDRIMVVHRHQQLRDDQQLRHLLESNVRIPPPLPGTETILPLDTAELVLNEALEMHHCGDSYLNVIAAGRYFAYSVRFNGYRATLGIRQSNWDPEEHSTGWKIDQLQGPANQRVPGLLTEHVKNWLRNHATKPKHNLAQEKVSYHE